MIDAGILLGLPRAVSAELIIQSAVGAATMLRDSGEHPTILREAVTSPGGTTIAAIRELEKHARSGRPAVGDRGRRAQVRRTGQGARRRLIKRTSEDQAVAVRAGDGRDRCGPGVRYVVAVPEPSPDDQILLLTADRQLILRRRRERHGSAPGIDPFNGVIGQLSIRVSAGQPFQHQRWCRTARRAPLEFGGGQTAGLLARFRRRTRSGRLVATRPACVESTTGGGGVPWWTAWTGSRGLGGRLSTPVAASGGALRRWRAGAARQPRPACSRTARSAQRRSC